MKLKDFAQIEYLIRKNKFPYWKLYEKDKTRRIPIMSFMSLKDANVGDEDFIEESLEALREIVETDPFVIYSIELLKNPKSAKDSRMGFFDFVIQEPEEEEPEEQPNRQNLGAMPPMPTQIYSMFMQQVQNMLDMQRQSFTTLLDTKEKTHRAELETILGRVKTDMENVQTRWELSLRERELDAKEKNLKDGKKGGAMEELLAGVLSGFGGMQNQNQNSQPSQTSVLSGADSMPNWYASLDKDQKEKIDKVLSNSDTKNYLLDVLNKTPL